MAETAVRYVHDVAVASIPGKTCSILLVADFLELFLASIYPPVAAYYLPNFTSALPRSLGLYLLPTRLSTSVRLECVRDTFHSTLC